MKKKFIPKELLLFLLLTFVSENLFSQTTYYWPGSGSWSAASAWATSSGGAATTTWETGSIAQFDVAGTITGPISAISVYDLIVNQNITVAGSAASFGTPSGHKVASISVAEGKTFDFGTQAFSTANGTGFVKNGKGMLKFGSSGGGEYNGGFTLNEGALVLGGAANSIGAGDLTINGGVLAASGTQSFSNNKLKAIVIGADFVLGDAVNDKNITIGTTAATTTTISLGSNVVRTITLAGAGVYTFMPVINGEGSSLVLNATSTGTMVLGGMSTYNGGTTVNGAKLKLDATGGALKSGSDLTVNGGLLHVAKSQVIGDFTMTAGELKIDAGQTLTILGEYNVTGGTIVNDGTILTRSTTGMPDMYLSEQVKVYASNRRITVSCTSLPIKSGSVIVFDAIGRLIEKETVSKSITELNIMLNTGVYFIKLDIDGAAVTHKLVVK